MVLAWVVGVITGEQVAERGLEIQERSFFNRRRESIDYEFEDGNQIMAFFERLLPRLRDGEQFVINVGETCLLYTSPSPRHRTRSRMPSSA